MSTIREIAAELDMQSHEIAATLDLGADYTDDQELTAEQEQVLRFTDEDGVYHVQEMPVIEQVHGDRYAVRFHISPDTYQHSEALDTREQAEALLARIDAVEARKVAGAI